jgi:hypothetical protein
MSRRQRNRRIVMAVGAAVCLVLSLVLVLAAADVVGWERTIRAGDVSYRASSGADTLWERNALLPVDVASRLLAVDDDVALRKALRSLRLAHLDDPIVSVSDPEVAISRNEAQIRLEAFVAGDNDAARRSRAAGLLGVLGLARFITETQEREVLLSSTVASLRLAIALDPSNDEAKHNLELAFQSGRGYQLTEGSGGANPTPGGSGAKGAGTGEPGSGY